MADLLDDLTARVTRLQNRSPGRILIGITGPPGSGKTTLASMLVERIAGPAAAALPAGVPAWADTPAAHVPMDGFHLADVELSRLGLSARKGAPETIDAGGYAALLRRIIANDQVWAPGFERTLEQPIAQKLPVTNHTRVVVSEGNYLLLNDPKWREVRSAFNEIWFCQLDDAKRIERLIARHVQFGKSARAARDWVSRSDERNAKLIIATKPSADLIIDVSSLPPTASSDGPNARTSTASHDRS